MDALKDAINSGVRRIPPWTLYVVGALYPAWMLWQAINGGLGVDPVKALEHAMGKAALQLLVAGLLVTPLRRFAGFNFLKLRRGIGVLSFAYVLLHLLIWLVLDVQIPAQIWGDILKRPYITIGMAGFVLMVPLALTSNGVSVRKLGQRWRQLHKLTYGVALLGAVHYVMLVKGFQIEPLVYCAAMAGLIALRLLRPAKRRAKRGAGGRVKVTG